MFLSSLLDVSEKTTNTVKWISVGAVVVLLAVIVFISFIGKKFDAKRIAFAGISLALSFVLSLAKVSPVLYGGSITLASFVPLLIFAYVYGVADGLLVGLIFGLLNFISSPYILVPMTFVLDYLLAFASIGIMGIFGKKKTYTWSSMTLGTLAVFGLRFIFHLVSGFIYFSENAIWVSLPEWATSNAFIYSFIYQCIYIPADCLICVIVIFILAKTGTMKRLGKILYHENSTVTANTEDANQNSSSEENVENNKTN